MGEEGQARLHALVAMAEDGYSMFNRLKKPAKRATWSPGYASTWSTWPPRPRPP